MDATADPAVPVTIESELLRAEISPAGAELLRLQHRTAGDLLWRHDPRVWFGVSPLLFPVIGRVRGGRILIDGAEYAMPQHGFAHSLVHDVTSRQAGDCRFVLAATPATRKLFPFDFTLQTSYSIDGARLSIETRVENTGRQAMSASFGFHPALRWPMPWNPSKDDYYLRFPDDDVLEVRRLGGGFLSAAVEMLPLERGRLSLSDRLFELGAAVLLGARSERVVFGSTTGAHEVTLRRQGLPHLGLWTKPGNDYLCIEPWHGFADPSDFEGEFRNKPGLFHLRPQESRTFGIEIALEPSR